MEQNFGRLKDPKRWSVQPDNRINLSVQSVQYKSNREVILFGPIGLNSFGVRPRPNVSVILITSDLTNNCWNFGGIVAIRNDFYVIGPM